MACVPQFDTMHPSMSLGANFNDWNLGAISLASNGVAFLSADTVAKPSTKGRKRTDNVNAIQMLKTVIDSFSKQIVNYVNPWNIYVKYWKEGLLISVFLKFLPFIF